MFYFKGQKKEIRRSIIKHFIKLNQEAFSNDNYVTVSKLIDKDRIRVVRLYCNSEITIPRLFSYINHSWENQKCVGTDCYFFETKKILEQSLDVVDGIVYENLVIEVREVKKFKSLRDFVNHKEVTIDLKKKYMFLLEEQIIASILEKNNIQSFLNNKLRFSNQVFDNMEFLIEKSRYNNIQKAS